MTNLKKLVSGLLVITMLLGIFLIPSMDAQAAELYGSVPKKVRIYVQEQDLEAITFDYSTYGEYIQNIKTSSKNLKAKQVSDWQEIGDETAVNYASIGLYASKKGKYNVSFDIYNADGTKKSSHKVTVYAYDDYPLKSITIGNKDITLITEEDGAPNIITAKSGKVKVTLNEGYKLNSLSYATYNEDGSVALNTFKNGKKITLGTNIPKDTADLFEGEYNLKYWQTQLFAPTVFLIEYKDKYTKQVYYTTYVVYKMVK